MTHLLFILEIISFTALILSAIFLGVAYIPHEKKVPNLKKSKYLIQLACILLGSGGILLVTHDYTMADISFFVQFMVQIESILLILAMILLLTKDFNTKQFIGSQTSIVAVTSIVLYVYYYIFQGDIKKPVYYVLCGIYLLLFLYYFFTYKKLFEQWKNKRSQYGKYGNTIKRLWLLLNIMGVMSMIVLFFPSQELFALLTLLYIFGIIIFIVLFYKLVILLNTNDFEMEKTVDPKTKDKNDPKKNIGEALINWIENKGFVESNITITTLSKHLGTNRTYLSNFINEHYGENFNSWLNKLRIEEAKRFLEDEELSLLEIADKVGFTDLPHFSKTFKSITGHPPSTWRKISSKEMTEEIIRD